MEMIKTHQLSMIFDCSNTFFAKLMVFFWKIFGIFLKKCGKKNLRKKRIKKMR